LAVISALDPDLQRVFYIAQKRASCSEMDGSHALCLLLGERGTGSIGRFVSVYSKIREGCGPEVEAVVLFSRNAWYRVEDAVSYLKSLGFNVSVQDLSGFTIQMSLVVRVYRKTSETRLPNGTVIRGEICEEIAKKAVEYFILVLGNVTSNTYFALKLQASKGLEKFVDASPITLVPKAVRSMRNASGCAPLADFLRERFNLTPEDAERLAMRARERGAPDDACECVSVYSEMLLEPRALNRAAATITVDELGLAYDALELLANAVITKQFSYKQSYWAGAYSLAKVTVWMDPDTGQIFQYRDDGYCSLELYAPIFGCCQAIYCRHTAFTTGPTSVYADAYGKWGHFFWPISEIVCTSSCLDVPDVRGQGYGYGRTCTSSQNSRVITQDCETACPCYYLMSTGDACSFGKP